MIFSHQQLVSETMEMWEQGLTPGQSTGWPSVDPLYTVAPAQWTLLTGTPNSGKSEWLDAVMVNLARRGKWKFVVYSPENWPLKLHASKIAEKYLGKPFDRGPTARMEKDELDEALAWMQGKFIFAKPANPTLEAILDEAGEHVSAGSQWMTGIVVDPWNQLEHNIPVGMREDQYLSRSLSTLIDFVRGSWAEKYHHGDVHFWMVAHPKIMQKDKNGTYPIPRPYDISGGAHWWNKADNCVTVWRDQAEGTQEVQIHVQKIRFKHIGRIGVTSLNYDRVTGRYSEQIRAVEAAASLRYRYGKDGE